MTYEFNYMMHLMGAASLGETVAPPKQKVDWRTVFALAKQQQVLPLISHAMRGQPPNVCPNVLTMVGKSYAQKCSVIALLDEMERAGIHSTVVKGFVVAADYASPDYRISSDTDIVVAPADEDRACAFLEDHGFTIRPRWENGHHAITTHPAMGVIEVHVRLYDEIVEEVWFTQIDTETLIREPEQTVATPDGTYWALGYTDHLIFMALHMIKHFILSGMSLRMMMDVALTIRKHRDQLDMERFWSTINSMNYGKLMNAVLWAMVRYCGFHPDDFPGIGTCDDAQIEMILDDLEKGGWLGKEAEEARKSGWHEYNRQMLMKSKSKAEYELYMLNWQHSLKLSTLFPGRKRLSRDYPCVVKYPFLIPFVWIHRIIFRGFALLRGKKWTKPIIHNETDISDESKARVAMFHNLEMM